MATSTMELTVNIPLDENEPLGARPNDALVITDVQTATPAYGHLKVGDTITTVNGRKIRDLRHFYQVVRAAHPVARIQLRRPRTKEEVPEEVKGDNLPPEISRAIARRPGYRYEMVTVERVQGKRFGLAIKTRDNRVMATEIIPNSMCSPHLQVLDHIVYIDGVRVTQAEVAQPLLTRGMKERGRITLVIGRPTTPEAKEEAKQVLKREDSHDPPSVRLNVDVQQIMRQQIVDMAHPTAPRSIFVHGPTPPSQRRVSFSGQNQVLQIQSDNTGRPLRPVTNGIPNSPIRQPQQ